MKDTSASMAKCIRDIENWGKLQKERRFDNSNFDPDAFAMDISSGSPKLEKLLETIKELDKEDLAIHGKLFKHFIYSDVKSVYGAKLIAAGLKSAGFHHAYKLAKGNRGMTFTIDTQTISKHTSNVFATLTSVPFFEKPIGVKFRKELLAKFNSRPENINGDNIRIIILDSGFREGVDLFDVKYVHLFEPIATPADEKQAIGRATRFCGQKGLHFIPMKGWPLHVYRYRTTIPSSIKAYMKPELIESADSFFNLFLKFSNIDPRKLLFSQQLNQAVILGSVDRALNKNVHNISIESDSSLRIADLFEEDKQVGGKTALTKFQRMKKVLREKFSRYTWPPVVVKNGCEVPPEEQGKLTGGPSVATFTPTQDFIRHYFTSKSDTKGMLLYHSVGTGKTCSAIATASSSFEQDDWTILYVTRHTLKGDVWKNMFGQVCSTVVQARLKAGLGIPDNQAARLKLISDGWFNPLSYKQFSNMLKGKNTLYKDLIKRNGKSDPLRKTLVIIDEAHKLFAPDVSGSEKPDVEHISKTIQKSFQKSGKDSVKVLLMTATPYTDNPMDMMALLNMIRDPDSQLPTDFEEFAKIYLDDNGRFSEDGLKKFLDDIAGQVSYLNRERDIRAFAYPIVTDVAVDMSDYPFLETLQQYMYTTSMYNNEHNTIQNTKFHLENDLKELRGRLLDSITTETVKVLREQYAACVATETEFASAAISKLSEHYSSIIADCNAGIKDCIKNVKDDYKEYSVDARYSAKQQTKKCKRGDKACRQEIKEQLKETLERLKDEQKFEMEECKNKTAMQKVTDCVKAAKAENTSKMNDITQGIEAKCGSIKQKEIDYLQNASIQADKVIAEERAQREVVIKVSENRLKKLLKQSQELKEKWQNVQATDISQRTAMEKCLKIKPAYKRILKNDYPAFDLENDSVNSYVSPNTSSRLFVVSGHGSENIITFKKRQTMPPDKVLIVFPVCGRYNWMNQGCEFVTMFNDPQYKKWMQDPIKHYTDITMKLGFPMHIYLPGDAIPDLSTNLFLNFDKEKTVVMKSGVFKQGNIPEINRDRFKAPPSSVSFSASKECGKYIGMVDNPMSYDGKSHHEVFKGNVFAPAPADTSYTKLVNRSFKMADIINTVGPGIYYYIGCRSSYQQLSPSMYNAVLEASAKQQLAEGRSRRIKDVKALLKSDSKSDSDSYYSASSHISSVSPVSPGHPASPTKPTKEVKKIIVTLATEVDTYFNGAKIEPARLDALHNELSKLNQQYTLPKTVLTFIKKIDALRVYKDDVATVKKLKKTVSTHDKVKYTFIDLVKSFVHEKSRYGVVYRHIGCIPSDIRIKRLKCSSSTLIKRIEKKFKQDPDNFKVELLDTPYSWQNNDTEQVVERLCEVL